MVARVKPKTKNQSVKEIMIMLRLVAFLFALTTLSSVAAYETCSICGDHHAVANLEGEVPCDNAGHPCGITEDLGRSGDLEQCEGGQGLLVKFKSGTFRSDDDGNYQFSCNCVRVDTTDNPCHVCGDNRIVSRPLDTITTLHHPPSDQYQYLNHYSCQYLQDGFGFDDNCFEHWGTMEYSQEMVAIFEENCGCEERTVCNICAPGQKLKHPTSSIQVPRATDYDDSKFYESDDDNIYKDLPCRVVEARAKNKLLPETVCRTYQDLVQNEGECGGCIPMTKAELEAELKAVADFQVEFLAEMPTEAVQLEEAHLQFTAGPAFWFLALMVATMMLAMLRNHRDHPINAGKEVELMAGPAFIK
jgi:hypothetical protein